MKKIGLFLFIMLMVSVKPSLAILGTVKGYISPATSNVKIGDKWDVKVMADTGTNKVSVVSLNLGVDTSKVKVVKVAANKTIFNSVFKEIEKDGLISIYLTSSSETASLPKGVIEVATLSLEAVANGTVSLTSKSYEIVGPSTTNDYNYGLDWQAATVVVANSEIGNGVDGVLKFKVAFAGVTSGAKCAINWPVDVTVMESNGNSKVYSNVVVGTDGSGQVLLTGISSKDKLAVFVKGPKHIQTKYANNNQGGFYNQSGGNILVDVDTNKTIVYDFTKYPLMAGDVNRDGKVDGLDFSSVKTDVNKRTEGSNMMSDLNGNCKLESQDLSLLMLAMRDKQEQLY